ncbi:restriction endonuclease [Kitasatospora sp. NPDC058218]|uniref:restriction endonuclease n=1 Tax=Kitasatospora sp. NPDC058218 TaxID=3346385 RepID=UPI0036DCF6F0
MSGWKLALIVLGTLAVPVLNNLSHGLPPASAEPGSGFMRIQDVSAALTVGLLIALPVEVMANAAYRRRLRSHQEEVSRLVEENRELRRRQLRHEADRKAAWIAGLELSREERRSAYGPSMAEIDTVSPADFEALVRRLMARDGLRAEVIGGKGDQAVDVLARTAGGGAIAVQCKHTTVGAKVSARVLYQIKGTSEAVYGAEESLVVTNGSFTRDAVQWGARHGIGLIDRDALRRWSQDADHLYQTVDLAIPSGGSPGDRPGRAGPSRPEGPAGLEAR